MDQRGCRPPLPACLFYSFHTLCSPITLSALFPNCLRYNWSNLLWTMEESNPHTKLVYVGVPVLSMLHYSPLRQLFRVQLTKPMLFMLTHLLMCLKYKALLLVKKQLLLLEQVHLELLHSPHPL